MNPTTRIVANPDLRAGDKIVTSDGCTTLESDATASSGAPDMVHVDVAAGTLYLAAAQSSRVLAENDAVRGGAIDGDYLDHKGYSPAEIELFALGAALAHGRERGVSDADSITWFCLVDGDDRERIAEHTGTAEDQLEPTADTALAFIESYRN